MSKVVISLKRARLARLTPAQRAERRTAMRLHREAVRTNEAFRSQHWAVLEAAITQRVTAEMAMLYGATRVLPDEEAITTSCRKAIDALAAEHPELFHIPQCAVPPRPQ